MNEQLWNQIVDFDFDNPPAEYSFTLRLAKENHWTKNFTQRAILEYKKFMYLAATANAMVSPSEVVDIVWHQHLIFSQSYERFCQILGKPIKHIPSTHDKKDFQKFEQAAFRTKELYTQNFGEQPASIWVQKDMYEGLNLRKSKLDLSIFIFIGTLLFLVLLMPAQMLLEPFYTTISGPSFLLNFIVFSGLVFIGLEVFNQARLKSMINKADKTSFLYQLVPSELIYLKNQDIAKVVHGFVDRLVVGKTIGIGTSYEMSLNNQRHDNSAEQIQVVTTLNELGTTHYPALLQQLVTKPVFANTTNAIDQLKTYLKRSIQFGLTFYTNFVVLSLLIMVGVTRAMTGFLREKPTIIIVVLSAIVVLLSIVYLRRLLRLVLTSTIPKLYKRSLKKDKEAKDYWEWYYFLQEEAALAIAFVPLVNYIDKNSQGGSTCGTSCGSSCGSSCGGGCGGGCGGCGG